ncbi:MAG: hypothetical protein FWC71_07130 [Defluviitaleaceae bacterium]|nr:hypothetical protein [Defluviitaleaceae bacterium]
MIRSYKDFVDTLLDAGFSMAGGNDEGIYSYIHWNWNDPVPDGSPIAWHTGDAETDPWEWRMRVLDERNDIAYAKLFFKKNGYIARAWYPFFLAARRGSGGRGLATFCELYEAGQISYAAKRVYDVVAQNGATPTHILRPEAGFAAKEDKAAFDRALVELQMRMFLTVCGKAYRHPLRENNENCWASTVLCTPENFFDEATFAQAATLTSNEAAQKITAQIQHLNPNAQAKKIEKFIFGA